MPTAEASSITVRYSLCRGEVWRYYWRAWARAKGLWRTHAAVRVLAAAIRFAARAPSHVSVLELAGAWTLGLLAALLLLPLWPLLKFRREERVLTLRPEGLTTSIGSLQGKRRWEEVGVVRQDDNGVLIVARHGSAFIVPNRAFADGVQRAAFLNAAQRWHAAIGTPPGMRRSSRVVLLGALGAVLLCWLVLRVPLPFVESWWHAGEKHWGDVFRKRNRIADGLLMTRALNGQTRGQITRKLGEPLETTLFPDWQLVYSLGAERRYPAAHSEWLVIRLDARDVAVEARVTRD